ncbi:MAG: M23 family metallopeptidase, partial [Spirochaetia bacterium]|nr:M23 family metallopeptidase [Spirochaetia bacterium]
MRPLFFFIFFLITQAFPWSAKQFPVKSVKPTSLFGESRGDHFHSGMDFASEQPIFPADDGEILLYRDQGENPLLPTFGSGNLVVMEHAEGFRTYYFHLQTNSIPRDLGRANINNVIGQMGETGHSAGTHLHFVIEDTVKNIIVNPLKHLPPIEDHTRPKVASILAVIKDKVYRLHDYASLRHSGDMKMFAKAWDLRYALDPRRFSANDYTATSVRRITFRIDDVLVRDYDFSCFYKRERGFLVEPNYSHDEVYGVSYNYRFGSFTPTQAQHTFEVYVEDWTGN